MNYQLLARFLGILSLLIGGFMLLSLLWAFPELGFRTDERLVSDRFEREGFFGLLCSTAISWTVGLLLLYLGRRARMGVFRREAMAIVGLSWMLATFLGAFPFLFSGTATRPGIKIIADRGMVLTPSPGWKVWLRWEEQVTVSDTQREILAALLRAGPKGLSAVELPLQSGVPDAERHLLELASRREWSRWLLLPGMGGQYVPSDRASHYRVGWVPIGLADALFESQSGFSTTGASTLAELNDSWLVPHCILFWRASTHFLGGLGIIVLFVVLLGQGNVGKALMRAEMPGPTKEGNTARMQHTAWMFGGTYLVLNGVLALFLMILGMSMFDAISHSFATMATGGFSTYTASIAHFRQIPGLNCVAIEMVLTFFMFLAGANFLLLFLAVTGKWWIGWTDAEFRIYALIVLVLTGVLAGSGMLLGDPGFDGLPESLRIAVFQVVSIQTSTGFATADFDRWNDLSRLLLVLTMFVGGCSGSTAGGMKVIRFVLLVKILRIEMEHAYHPSVVRLLRLGGKAVEDQQLRRNILVYCGILSLLFLTAWIALVAVEPTTAWNGNNNSKLIDSASAVVATLNNIGPGLGIVGPTQSFAEFCSVSKMVFVFLMMVGRLEIFPILVLFMPRFWKDQ